jgi:predicted DNA-binding protein (MmcQ/YjbR family)
MPTKDPLTTAELALRAHAMKYPGVTEDFPWGERAIKIKGKVFLFLSRHEKDKLSLSVKLPVSGQYALGYSFAEPTGYGLGKHGWVSCRFSKGDDIPVELIMDWIDESFRVVAPKSVVAALEVEEEEPKPKKASGKRKPPVGRKKKPGT